eukprot:1159636-Pelagomonas_calceolata.AAC.5
MDGRVLSYIHASPGKIPGTLTNPEVPTIISMHGWPSSAKMASLMSANVTEVGLAATTVLVWLQVNNGDDVKGRRNYKLAFCTA